MLTPEFNAKKGIFALILASTVFFSFKTSAQECGNPTIDQANYCDGQLGQVRLTDPATNVLYHWYKDNGSGGLSDALYGPDGDGRYFVSNGIINAPGINTEYYYRKEVTELVGPAVIARAGGTNAAPNSATYDMGFDTEVDFWLDTVSVWAKPNSAATSYSLQVRIVPAIYEAIPDSGVYSDIYKVVPGTTNWTVFDIPTTGVYVETGTNYLIQVRSFTDVPEGVTMFNEFYWWDDVPATYVTTSYLAPGNQITINPITTNVLGNDRYPMIFDWRIRLNCDSVNVPLPETMSCCTPVDTLVDMVPDLSVAEATDFPMNITVSGASVMPGMYFRWYDAAGAEIGGASGVDANVYSPSASGIYTVRVVGNVADIDALPCYQERSVWIQDRVLFGTGDDTLCAGESFTLSSIGGLGNYAWHGVGATAHALIADTTLQTITVNPTTPGVYQFVISADAPLANAVIDGNFTNFNSASPAFTTSYGQLTGLTPISGAGQYKVSDQIDAWGSPDNRCNGMGGAQGTQRLNAGVATGDNFLYGDAIHSPGLGGSPTDAQRATFGMTNPAWQQNNRPVTQNQTYEFRVDVSQWEPGDFDFMLMVNGQPLDLSLDGVPLGSKVYEYTSGDHLCQFRTLTGTWNSGTNTSATLTLAEVRGNGTDSQSEFAMDNISFGAPGTQTDTVTIMVTGITDPDTNIYCDGGGIPTNLGVDGVTNFDWWEDALGTIPLSNSTTPGIEVTWTPPVVTTGDQTFYVTSAETTNLPGGNPFGPSGGSFGVAPEETYFTVTSTILLESFEARPEAWTGTCGNTGTTTPITFEAYAIGAATTYTHTETMTCGSYTTVNSNWTLPPDDYILRTTFGGQLQRVSNFGASTYSIPGYVSITGYEDANYEGQYRNWVVKGASNCNPSPIIVRAVGCCVQPTPTLSITTGTATECQGTNIVLTAGPNGATAPVVYKWYKDGVELAGRTDDTLNLVGHVSDAASYTVSISSSAGCTAEGSQTAATVITINAVPSAVLSGTASICDDGVTTTPLTITFTGSGPFNIDLDTTGGTHTSLVGVNSPHVVNVTADQSYTISNLSDANCTGASTTGTATITYLDDVVATTSLECDDINPALAVDEFQIRVTVTQGDLGSINISELTAHGVTFTDQGGGVWLSNAVNEANSVNINVTDVNDCGGGLTINALNQQCSCPASGTIALSGAATVCPGSSSSIDATFSTTVGVGPFNLTITRPVSGDTVINSATSVFTLPIDEVGAYSATVEDVGNGCTATLTGSVSLANHTLPTAVITGTATICDDGVTTTPLTITFTGASTFNVDLDTTGGTHTSLAGVTSPHVVNVSADQTYTLSNLSDANCPGTGTSGSAVVTYHDDVIANTQLECRDINPALANDEFQIRVTITQGDLGTAVISELTAHGVTFTDQGGGVWLSNAINELNTVDINVTDVNDCNGGMDINGLIRTCSCPTAATAAITTATVCPDSTTTLDITWVDGGTSTTYDISISTPSGPVVANNVVSPYSITVSDVGNYQATVTDNGDACDAFSNQVSLSNHPLPTSVTALNGSGNICDNGTDQATIDFTFTGTSSFTFTYTDGVTPTTLTTASNPHSINTMTAGTYTVTSVVDGNNCPASSMTGSAVVTLVPIPTPTVSGGPGTFCDGQGSHVLTASGITVGNSYEWYQNGSPTGIVDQNLTVTNLSGAGTYTVVETSAACGDITSSNSEVITVNPIPTVDAGLPPDPFFAGEQGTLNGSSNGTTFSWTPAADAQSPTSLTTVITPAASGFFTLTASNGNCNASDSVYVTVWEPILVPNAFTPNDDTENDVWDIDGLTSYPNARVKVFNRWGAPVYTSIGTYKPWDGKRQGQNMPIGTYYWIIEPDEGLAPMSGSVTIVR